MPTQYEKIRDSELARGKSRKEAERIGAATYNKHHPNNPMGPHTDYASGGSGEFSFANAPRHVIDVYHKHRQERLDHGATEDVAHRHAMRQVHNAGWYKGRKGWKRVHEDLRSKINIRDAIRQPDGRYMIEDVDVFYPNAAKEGEQFDAGRIRGLIENTNRMIGEGGQRPGLLEGHPPEVGDDTPDAVKLAIGKQYRPMGYAVNFRENSHRAAGWAKCDLVDVDPEFVEKQKHRPLSGLSAGIAKDAGSLNERFNHVAALGSSLQALSRLPRTELSEMYSANQVCFAADATPRGNHMPLSEEHKKLHNDMADCYSAYSAALKSYAAEEPDGLPKLQEAKKRMGHLFSANRAAFSESMPDEPLMKQAEHLDRQPSEGPDVLEGKDNFGGAPTAECLQEHEGEQHFASDDPRIAQVLEENRRLQQQLSGAIGKIARKDFDSEIKELEAGGAVLPPKEKLDSMFKLCFSSSNPAAAMQEYMGFLKSLPKRSSAADYGTVLGTAGASPAPSAPGAKPGPAGAKTDQTVAHRALGVNFSSEEIEWGRAIGAAATAARA